LVVPYQGSPQARPPAPDGFEEFFRHSFRELVRTAMFAGANPEEAKDAAAKTLAEMLQRWPVPENPIAYARQAVVHNFVKEKTRGNERLIRRLIERGHISRHEGFTDDQLTAFEDSQWVTDVLSVLPPTQHKVMECIARGLASDEIAETLGMSRDAVRRNLCDARRRLAQTLQSDGDLIQSPRLRPRSVRREAQ
jgi:RNA polymerase sigma factor (sigma-70 family)